MFNVRKVSVVGLLFTLGVLTILIGSSYAALTRNVSGEKQYVINAGNLDFEIINESDAISLNDAYPETNKTGLESTPYLFSLRNNDVIPIKYTINLEQIETGNDLGFDKVKFYLEHDDNTVGPELLSRVTSLYDGVIEPNETLDFTLRLWMDINATIEEAGKTFKVRAVVNGQQVIDEEEIPIEPEITGTKLYTIIRDKSLGNEDGVINYSEHSGMSGTNGVYATTKTEGNVPVYFYRGNVDNNVIFNNMCWKIVRTTETKGVKLIYNGLPTVQDEKKMCIKTGSDTSIGSSQFSSFGDDNAYVGYMTGNYSMYVYEETHENVSDSIIKTYIDTWFENNFDQDAISKLEDTVFCNDRSTVNCGDNNSIDSSECFDYGYGRDPTGYGSLSRSSYYTITPNPTYVCEQTNDKFTLKDDKLNYNSSLNGNKTLDYPVGLLTSDEAVFAGFNTYESNKTNYQNNNNYLTGSSFFTLSPARTYEGNGIEYGSVNENGYINTSFSIFELYVRPVISLLNTAVIEDYGNGTSSNPYVVK